MAAPQEPTVGDETELSPRALSTPRCRLIEARMLDEGHQRQTRSEDGEPVGAGEKESFPCDNDSENDTRQPTGDMEGGGDSAGDGRELVVDETQDVEALLPAEDWTKIEQSVATTDTLADIDNTLADLQGWHESQRNRLATQMAKAVESAEESASGLVAETGATSTSLDGDLHGPSSDTRRAHAQVDEQQLQRLEKLVNVGDHDRKSQMQDLSRLEQQARERRVVAGLDKPPLETATNAHRAEDKSAPAADGPENSEQESVYIDKLNGDLERLQLQQMMGEVGSSDEVGRSIAQEEARLLNENMTLDNDLDALGSELQGFTDKLDSLLGVLDDDPK